MDYSDFNEAAVLSYLGLPLDYEPSPRTATIPFLRKHLSQLPPHIVCKFSSITSPKLRTTLIPIRNRRLRYVNTHPAELNFTSAWSKWPELWEGRERHGREEGKEERNWVEQEFLKGETKHVGKLGNLLGEYEEEREAERVRTIKRELGVSSTATPESEEEGEEEEEEEDSEGEEETVPLEEESEGERQRYFERLVRERFIYGLLPGIDYDKVDYDESLDVDDDRETQDRWFDEDDND